MREKGFFSRERATTRVAKPGGGFSSGRVGAAFFGKVFPEGVADFLPAFFGVDGVRHGEVFVRVLVRFGRVCGGHAWR